MTYGDLRRKIGPGSGFNDSQRGALSEVIDLMEAGDFSGATRLVSSPRFRSLFKNLRAKDVPGKLLATIKRKEREHPSRTLVLKLTPQAGITPNAPIEILSCYHLKSSYLNIGKGDQSGIKNHIHLVDTKKHPKSEVMENSTQVNINSLTGNTFFIGNTGPGTELKIDDSRIDHTVSLNEGRYKIEINEYEFEAEVFEIDKGIPGKEEYLEQFNPSIELKLGSGQAGRGDDAELDLFDPDSWPKYVRDRMWQRGRKHKGNTVEDWLSRYIGGANPIGVIHDIRDKGLWSDQYEQTRTDLRDDVRLPAVIDCEILTVNGQNFTRRAGFTPKIEVPEDNQPINLGFSIEGFGLTKYVVTISKIEGGEEFGETPTHTKVYEDEQHIEVDKDSMKHEGGIEIRQQSPGKYSIILKSEPAEITRDWDNYQKPSESKILLVIKGNTAGDARTQQNLEVVSESILVELNKEGSGSLISRLPALKEWLTRFKLDAEPFSRNTIDRDVWLIIVLTADGKNGIAIPTLDSAIGPRQELYDCFDRNPKYDGTQGILMKDIKKLARVERDASGRWIVVEKGIIDRVPRTPIR